MKKEKTTDAYIEKPSFSIKLDRRKKDFKRNWQLYVMSAIPILLVFVFCYLPMPGIILAFKKFRYDEGIFGSAWVGLENFKYLFLSDKIWILLRNTIVSNIVFFITGTAGCILLAILMYELNNARLMKVFQTVLITPHFLSFVMVSYILFAFLGTRAGLLTNILAEFGFKRIDFYASPGAWPWILSIVNIWKTVGMGSLIYYAVFVGVDTELLEAARIDGARKVQLYRYIMVPALKKLLCLNIIGAVSGILGSSVDMFYTLPKDNPLLYETTDVLSTYILRLFRTVGDMGTSSAASLALNVVGFILVIVCNSIINKIDPECALF